MELKKCKGTEYVLSWKSKGVFNSKLKRLYTSFMNSIKLSVHRIGINFDKDPLSVKQNNYFTRITKVYIVCDLDAFPRNPTNNFKFKIFLFGVTNIVKNSNKEKYVYNVYGITIDSSGSCSFDNDFALECWNFWCQ